MIKNKIYRYEYAMLIILSQVGSVFLVSIQESVIGKDAYIALLMGLAFGIGISALFLYLLKKNGYSSLAELNVTAFGRGGNIMTVLYCVYFLLGAGLLLNYYGVFTVETILKDMPITVFFVAVTAVFAFAAQKGATTMGRMGVVFAYILLGCVALSFFIELPYADIENLKPAFTSDKHDILRMAALFGFLQFGDIISVFCIAPHVEHENRLMRLSVVSALIGGGIVFVFCFLNALVLGDSLIYQYSGFLRTMKLVDLGGILNRMEVLVVAGYFFATVFRLMMEFFVITDNFGNVFNRKKDPRVKWGIFCVCCVALVIFASSVSTSERQTEDFVTDVYPYIAAVFQLALPAVTALALKKRPKPRH